MIHKSSLVDSSAVLGENVQIGPFSIIGKNVKLGNNVNIMNNVVIDGITDIEHNVTIFPYASIGLIPQDLKFKGENSKLYIGKNCKIREYVTINTGTEGGGMLTNVGENCLLMVGTHIAHDCQVGSNVIFANNATLAGHVSVGDDAIIGGLSAVHQFVRVGEGAIIGGMSGVTSDVIPYGSVIGNRAKLNGLNLIGLKRKNIDKVEINAMRKLYKNIFEKSSTNFKDRISNLDQEFNNFFLCKKIISFLKESNTRAICHP